MILKSENVLKFCNTSNIINLTDLGLSHIVNTPPPPQKKKKKKKKERKRKKE